MVWIALCVFLTNLLYSSDFLDDVSDIQTKLAEQEIDRLESGESKGPLSDSHIEALLPQQKIDETQTCAEEEKRKSKYEVVMIADVSSQPKSKVDLPNPLPVHKKLANSLLQHAASSNLSEEQLAASMAGLIRQSFLSDEAKYNALAAYSKLLYENYNNSRNPGKNTAKNNPNNMPLPKGDMTISEISKAALNKDEFSGGVCNDISEAVALIAQNLFPNKDVLIVNSGTHHGVVISDGKTNRIIDKQDQMILENNLKLNNRLTATNMRISKMVGGKLKQIAVVDSETGLMMEKAFQTGMPLLKTSADVNSVLGHFGFSSEGKLNKHAFTSGVGVGEIVGGKMYVAIAKYDYFTDNWHNYIGVGGSIVDREEQNLRYQVHLRAGTERTFIKYASPHSTFRLSSGLQLEGMYGFKPAGDRSGQLDISVGLDLFTRAEATYAPSSKFKMDGSTEFRVVPGITNWGASTGAFADGVGSGIGETFENMNLQLNQIFSTLGTETNIGSGVNLVNRFNYQGSSVGQAIDTTLGVDIKAKDGVQILLFTGYGTSKLPGFETKESLLVGQNGLIFGAGIGTNSGISFTTSVRDISPDTNPWVQAGLKIETESKSSLQPKRPKRDISSDEDEY